MDIYEDELTGDVIINGKRICGFICDEICSVCGCLQIHHDKFDAYFCPQCNEWLEVKCGDPDCEYCKDRTEKPL